MCSISTLNKFQESKVSIKVTPSSCLPRQSLIKYLVIFKNEKVILTPPLGFPWAPGISDLPEFTETIPKGGHGNPLQYSWLENPEDRGAWWTIVQRVPKNHTWLKRLSIEYQGKNGISCQRDKHPLQSLVTFQVLKSRWKCWLPWIRSLNL